MRTWLTMDQRDDPDKTGDELKAQRFQMLADIARSYPARLFSRHTSMLFCACASIARSETQHFRPGSGHLHAEPLISAKLLHLANSVAFNPNGQEIL